MDTPINIPKLGWTMEEGTLIEWLVADGATVALEEPLYVLETDKVENEITAPVGGVLHQTGEAGRTYQVGETIGTIESDGEGR